MDFGEYVRGGTAPLSGKPKIPPALNPTVLSRPKTRAVDNDLQDMNVDLKVNRIKTGSNNNATNLSPEQTSDEVLLNEKEIARINLNDWNDKTDNNNAAAKRAPSRGKKSKDPTRKDNSLMSGLSAYTQNMPAIVLNTNRKSHKGPSASPRMAKESKNISQINELRAAYGTDFPLNKPVSPPGKTRGSKPSTAEAPLPIKPLEGLNRASLETRAAPSSANRKNTTDTASVASSVTSSKEIETPERGRELLSNRSTVSSSSEISHSPTRKLKKNNSLLKVSFSSKHSDESNFDGNNIDHSSTSPENGDTNETERNRTRSYSGTGPSPTDNVLVPVDDFLNEVIVTGTEIQKRKKEVKSQNATGSGSNRASATNSPDVNNRPLNLAHPSSNLISFSISDYTIGPVDTPRDELFADLNDHEIPEDEIVPIYDGADEERIHQKKHSYIADETFASQANKSRLYLQDPNNASYNHTRNSAEEVETEEHHEEFDETEHQEELSPRPQSRKLYLGSEKPLLRDKSNSKVPRSAGARYGAYSPIKGGVELPPAEIGVKTGGSPRSKKSQFRKLSSHGDLADWVDESNPDLRPPSRQSTAFPVHLSSLPGSSSPLALIQPATMNKMEIITTEPDHDIAESPASVRSSRQPMTINTEPRTVKKVVTSVKGEEEKKGPSIVTPSNSTVNTSESTSTYNVRPPSRQKVAAQHLFDNEHPIPAATLHDNPSIETITIVSRRSSRADGPASNRKLDSASGDIYVPSEGSSTVRLRTANGHRPTSTRGKPATSSAYEYDDDYNDDGFAALDPNDNFAPFPITVNYGNNFEQPNPSAIGNMKTQSNDNRIRTSAGTQKILVEDYPVDHRPISYENTNTMGYGNQSKPRKVNHISPKNATNKETLKDPEPPHHRPKSVTAIPGHSAHPGAAGSKYGVKPPALNYDVKQEENTLRSKSANNYAGHHRLYNPVHSNDPNTNNGVNGSGGVAANTPHLPSKPIKTNPNPPTSQGARTRAWGDQPDPRNIPRAQVSIISVFSM